MHNINKEHLKQELVILIGFGCAVAGITATVIAASYWLSMYQTVGWIS